MIQKLCSFIAIEAEQGEGQSFFDLFDLFQDLGFFCVQTARCSLQEVAISTQSILQVNFPDKDSPQWATA
jgi:hypothetical protein